MISKKQAKKLVSKLIGGNIILDDCPVSLTIADIQTLVDLVPSVTGDHPIITVCMDDLASCGYDTNKLSEQDIADVANKMSDYFSEDFYTYLRDAADFLELPKISE